MTERRSKYNARPVIVAGERLDSAAEGRRYAELLLLQQAGQISDLQVHPVFELVPPFEHQGIKERGINYEADFEYYDHVLERETIEDVKGMETAVFRLKRKLFLWRYPTLAFVVVKA